jgi:5S rRNA maturation endonuclease (ribonuclease M5)
MKEGINLNSVVFNEMITKADILKHIRQEEVYTFYIEDDIVSGTTINSPLRVDNIPSFAIFYHKSGNGALMFYDFTTKESGDCFVFVGKLFNLTLKETMFKIACDFGLSNFEMTAEKKRILDTKRVIYKEQVKLGIKSRKWKIRDKKYWSLAGIIKPTLLRFNVSPINYVFFNDTAYKTDPLAYAYIECKDDEVSYKIYQPYNKKHKWINNANYSVHQGYTQLPKTGELLIITKSIKDVMSLWDVAKTHSIGLQSESVMMKHSVMNEYKSRFTQVMCLFDNDKAGKRLSEEFTKEYNVPHFYVPGLENVTDFSDLVNAIGIPEAKEEVMKRIKKLKK